MRDEEENDVRTGIEANLGASVATRADVDAAGGEPGGQPTEKRLRASRGPLVNRRSVGEPDGHPLLARSMTSVVSATADNTEEHDSHRGQPDRERGSVTATPQASNPRTRNDGGSLDDRVVELLRELAQLVGLGDFGGIEAAFHQGEPHGDLVIRKRIHRKLHKKR